MAEKIRHVAVGNNTYDLQGGNLRIFYGTCSTGATAQVKVANIAEVSELETGDVFYIKMTNAQTYNGVPKLQINSLAAKNIARTGSVTASRYEWNAGEILEFSYDGTSMIIVDGAIADTTYYGLTKLSSAVDSNSEETAATSKAVKTAYDAANKTMTGATATAAGESGNVPQPAAGDQGKFLRGDGTWGEGSGTVDSVNNVQPDISKNVTLTGSDINVSSTDTATIESVLSAHSRRLANIADLVYPIGAIYMSVILVTPNTLFGGKWERLKDKFLLAAGDTYEAGKTGGAATHTLTTSEMPSHNHVFSGTATNTGIQSAEHTHNYTDYYATTTGGTSITVAQMATHNHGNKNLKGGFALHAAGTPNIIGGTDGIMTATYESTQYRSPNGLSINNGAKSYGGVSVNASHTHDSNGSGNSHTHSGENTSTTRTSQGISANHTHSVTASGTIGSTGNGNAFSIMPPYLSVYMWKRVA